MCRVLANRQSSYNTAAMLSSSQDTRGRYNSRRTPSSPRILFRYSSSSLLFWSRCELFSNCSASNNKVVCLNIFLLYLRMYVLKTCEFRDTSALSLLVIFLYYLQLMLRRSVNGVKCDFSNFDHGIVVSAGWVCFIKLLHKVVS